MFSSIRDHHSRIARPLLAAALGASIAIVSACGSDSSTGPKNLPGAYVLMSVNASPLPYTVPNTIDHTIVVNSVTATLNSNTYAVAGTGTEDGNATPLITDAGTYTLSGSTLHFTSTTFVGASYTAQASDSTITVTIPGGFVNSTNSSFALVFKKSL